MSHGRDVICFQSFVHWQTVEDGEVSGMALGNKEASRYIYELKIQLSNDLKGEERARSQEEQVLN